MTLSGAGVDLISLARAKRFLKSSGSRVKRLLAGSETRLVRSLTPLMFARLFSAKEAYLKATHDPTLDLSDIEVKILPRGRFRVKSLRLAGRHFLEAEGCFFHASSHVGALVILWKP